MTVVVNTYAYWVPITCPKCGGRVDHVSGSAEHFADTEMRAVLCCSECSRHFVFSTFLHEAPVERFRDSGARQRRKRARADALAEASA